MIHTLRIAAAAAGPRLRATARERAQTARAARERAAVIRRPPAPRPTPTQRPDTGRLIMPYIRPTAERNRA